MSVTCETESMYSDIATLVRENLVWSRNQLHPTLLSLGAINPWAGNDSSPRVQMLLSHVGQALQVVGTTARRCFTGIEFELAKATLSRRMPADASVLKVIEKYQRTLGAGGIKENPLTLVVYEDYKTREIGVVDIPTHSSFHQHYGFPYVKTRNVSRGDMIAADTVLADTPAVDENGFYRLGADCEIAFMTVPAVIEDGMVVSKSFLKKMTSKGYESRVVSFGKKRYPINLYGDSNNPDEYKPFPDIGERVRPDGLLFALRAYDDLLAPIEMDDRALRTPDMVFDKLVYGIPGAKVVDITVHHDTNPTFPPTPVGMEQQAVKYYHAHLQQHQQILDLYYKLKRERKEELVLKPEFNALVVAALNAVGVQKHKVVRTYRNIPIDDWRVEITFEYDAVPTIGYKATGLHGNKAVIVDIEEDEDMPIDGAGNRVEVIMDGDSVTKRMNPGVLYEQFYNACSRTLTQELRRLYDLDPHDRPSLAKALQLVRERPAVEDRAWLRLMGYYWLASPVMANRFEVALQSGQFDVAKHLACVLHDGIYLEMPTDTPIEIVSSVKALRQHYHPTFGPVTYRGKSGRLVTTTSNVLVGSVQIVMLEKTATDWSAVSSAKLQHFGVPAKLTNVDKYAAPGRSTPTRITGEAELRLLASVMGGDAAAEMLDRSNNPRVHKHEVETIITHPTPTRIKQTVDRSRFPRGQGRNLVYPKQTLECGGLRYVRGQGGRGK